MSSLLIRNVMILDGQMEKALLKDVLLEDDRIAQVSLPGSMEERDDLIDGHGRMALIPGLVNTHTHAAMSLLRGLGEEKPLMEWLKEQIWPIEAKLRPDHVYWGTLLAMTEMLSRGITCFGDMYFEMEQVARACMETGMRAGLSRGIIGDDRSRIQNNRSLCEQFHEPQGLIHVQFGPHAPYTVPLKTLEEIAGLAREYDTGVHFHFLETQWEMEYLNNEYSMDPSEYLQKSTLLDVPQLILAHAVWLPEEDFSAVRRDNVTLVHNIKSNLKLGSGIMPLQNMLETGIKVALGSDGAASNNELDIWDEMKTAALVHKGVFRDPTMVKALDILEMATLNGAKALGFDKTGLIREGWKADLVLIDLDKPHYVGVNQDNLACYIVYAGSSGDVQSTIINGKVIYRDHNYLTADLDQILFHANSARNELLT